MAIPTVKFLKRFDGDKALLVRHCALFGRMETWAKKYWITVFAQSDDDRKRIVSVTFNQSYVRRPLEFEIYEVNLRYLTIEVRYKIVYDSRSDVPCDLSVWNEVWRRNPAIKGGRDAAYPHPSLPGHPPPIENRFSPPNSSDYHKRMEAIRELFPRAYEKWTEDEEHDLRDLFLLDLSIEEIARRLKRQPSAIQIRLERLGLVEPLGQQNWQ